jgi:glucose uptake protein GlcU
MIYLILLIVTVYLTSHDIKRYIKTNSCTNWERIIFAVSSSVLLYVLLIFIKNTLTFIWYGLN